MKRIRIGFTLLLLVCFAFPIAAQDDRSLVWNRWDVTIDQMDVVGNQFVVTEAYDIQFDGAFTFGTAVIPTSRLDRITNVAIRVNGTSLRPGSGNQPGTFTTENTSEGLSIVYTFPSRVVNTSAQVELRYTVVGALRVYETGDQLLWSAIPTEHFGFPIRESTTRIVFPSGYVPQPPTHPVEVFGAPATFTLDGTTLTVRAERGLGGTEGIDIAAQYPHHPDARRPAWQERYDQQEAFNRDVRPLIDVGVLAFSLALMVGGGLFILTRYQTRGRDPQVGAVPELLAELPSNLSPAVVGTLIDETADLRDVLSTIIDLGRRGYLVIEEEQESGLFGIGRINRYTFKRTDKLLEDLRPFERTMVTSIFRGGELERTLDSMRNTFYVTISQVQSQLYEELTAQGLFDKSPQATRSRWQSVGTVLIVLGLIGGFAAVGLVAPIPSLLCLPGALIVIGVLAMLFARGMPARTAKGAEEAAKWRSFERYLRRVGDYDVEQAKAQFERFLPYAMAFGIEREWVDHFKGLADVPIPIWYWPTYIGPYRGGYLAGSPLPHGGGMQFPGDIARAGGDFSFDTVSSGISGGLESVSSGLSKMFENASSVMTSRPQSSSGGSFSGGGGFSGGGFSGGGSRGFG